MLLQQRGFVSASLFAAALLGPATTAWSAGDEWEIVTPDQVGLSTDIGDKLDAAFHGGQLDGVHAMVLVRDGKLALERYETGDDEIHGSMALQRTGSSSARTASTTFTR